MEYNQKLPKKVEAQLDAYIERIKAIQWFKVSPDINREAVDTQVNVALKAFGVEASIEYRSLKTEEDWYAARDAAWDAAWYAARDAAWRAAWDAAWDAAWGVVDVLALNLDDYKSKYPNGNFINLIPLWEAGLYPCGVIDGKFVVYVPTKENPMPQFFGESASILIENHAWVNGKKYKLVEE